MHTRALMISCCHLNRLPPLRPYFLRNFAANRSAQHPAAVLVPIHRAGPGGGESRMGVPRRRFPA
jgi:hypothetical protein